MDSRCPSVNTSDSNVSFISAILELDKLKFGFCANHVAAHTRYDPSSFCFVAIPMVKRIIHYVCNC
jgi:hypothetical protein